MHGLDGRKDEESLFNTRKDKYKDDLKTKAMLIPEPDNAPEINLIDDITATSAAYQFYMVSKAYLDAYNFED